MNKWIISVFVPLLGAIALQLGFALEPNPTVASAIVPVVTVLVLLAGKLFKTELPGVAKALIGTGLGVVWNLTQHTSPSLPAGILQGIADGLLAAGFWSAAKATMESVKTKAPSA